MRRPGERGRIRDNRTGRRVGTARSGQLRRNRDLRRNRARVPHIPDQPRVAPAAQPVDDAPAPPPKLDTWEDPVLRKDDAAVAAALARPDDAEAAASKRRARAVTNRRAIEAEMKASAGPLKAIPADSPYKPWALDAKNQRWRLQAMHPV